MTLALDERRPGGGAAPAPSRPTAPTAGPGTRTRPGWRTDVQGLRAVAVLVVVLYHAGVPGLDGGYVGVDVFFVISGFLITGHLLRDLDDHGRIRFARFWAGRARRLLPLATLVVLTTLVVARLWGSPFRIASIAWDALLAGVNGLNYRLAAQGVDYQHVDGPESPLQHFWSLAVEEQFYLVWPLLLGLLALVPRRHRRRAAAAGLALVVAGSLLVSVTTTATNAPLAYFSLQTRAWELGVGALLAVGAARVAQLPVPVARVLAWAGLAAVLGSTVAFDATTPFPGSAALVPVLGTAAVIAARGHGAGRLLGTAPLQGLGAVSYGWYLWHWPAMILVPTVYGRELPWWVLLELAAVTLWLATMTYWLVERPLQRSRWPVRRWLAAGGTLVASSVAAAGVALVTLPSLVGPGQPVAPLVLDEVAAGGLTATLEMALATRAVPANLTPTVARAPQDQPVSSTDGCHADFLVVEQPGCRYGDPAGYRTVVLVGDSHAQQWLPALDRAAQERGWRLVAWTKSACPVAELDTWAGPLGRAYTECTDWRRATRERIAALDPDLVVVSQSDTVVGDDVDNDTWSARTLEGLAALGVPRERLLYVLDTPYRAQEVPDCLGRHLDDARACVQGVQGSAPYGDRHGALAQALSTSGVATVDPTPWLCTEAACPAVVGDVMTYRDSSHVTATYSGLLAPVLGEVVAARLEGTA